MEMLVDIAIPVVVIMMMFVVGLELSLEDFRRIQGYPKPVLVGTAGQLIILPLIAAVLAFILDPPRHIVAGMVLVAACPAGAISNYYVYLARANVALSVTLTAVTTVLAFVTLPVLTALGFKLLLDQQEAIPVPVSDMMSQLFVVLLLSTAAGMWVSASSPDGMGKAARKLAQTAQPGSACPAHRVYNPGPDGEPGYTDRGIAPYRSAFHPARRMGCYRDVWPRDSTSGASCSLNVASVSTRISTKADAAGDRDNPCFFKIP